jgi:hypothetical protein
MIVAGLAAVALAGVGPRPAGAAPAASHELIVHLPNGAVERIAYTGDVPPEVVVMPASPMPDAFFAPTFASLPTGALAPMPTGFAADPVFAAMDRMSATIDRAMDTLFQRADSLALMPPHGSSTLQQAVLSGRMPAGASGYSMVAAASNGGVCMRSVQVTVPGNGGKPKVVRHESGNCGAASGSNGAGSNGNAVRAVPLTPRPSDLHLVPARDDMPAMVTHQPRQPT